MPFLRLHGVTRSVVLPGGGNLEILRGIDLDVEVGEHVSVVGRSGSGKSTLLNILGLIDTPTSGALEFDGVPLDRLSGAERDRRRGRDVGFIFQQFNLLPRRTALENVITPLLYATGRQFWRRQRLATEMLERVGLGDRLASTPDQLSGGEQQRVAVARAFAADPRVVFADEPTGNLDARTGASVIELIEEIHRERGTTLVLVTHDMDLAGRADRVLRLHDGRLVADEARG